MKTKKTEINTEKKKPKGQEKQTSWNDGENKN